MREIRYLSVTELARLLCATLEKELPELYFEGEISEITFAKSGHVYFTIKDAQSQIRAVMWNGFAKTVPFKLAAGVAVLCHGRPNFYHKSGQLQIVVHKILEAGEGELRKKFLKLKEKLEKEGLFAPERKRALPFLPRAIGVVTSATGAVIHDIMVKIRERMPCLKVYLIDVRVQGEGAAQEIADGVRYLSESGVVEVIIVARGGGSLEDLWAFNEEVVVRAIFASRVPVISGVGHEVDVSLSDLVADVRAPTPTAAAEIVVPRRDELLKCIGEFEKRLFDYDRWLQVMVQEIDDLGLRLEKRISLRVEEARLHLQTAYARLKLIQPSRVIQMFAGRVELLEEKLYGSAQRCFALVLRRIDNTEARLKRALPPQKITLLSDTVRYLEKRLFTSYTHGLNAQGAVLSGLSARLEAVSPLQVLKRGYSIVESEGAIVKSVEALKTGDAVQITFYDGIAGAQVTSASKRMVGNG